MLDAFRGDLGAALRAAASSWDSGWYQLIVAGGYAHTSPSFPKAGFYPGYPLLVSALYEPLRAIGTRLDPGYSPSPPLTLSAPLGQDPLLDASLLLVPSASLVIALVALWRLYEPELGATATLIGCGLLLTAPSAFFLSSAHAESSFIAATALTFLFAHRGRWIAAGGAGAIACLIREPGVWLVVPLAILWLQAPRPRPLWPALAGGSVLLAGAAVFPAYCLLFFGDALLYVHLQASHWGHLPSNPLQSCWMLIRRAYWGVLAELRVRPLPVVPEAVTGHALPGPRTYVLDGAALVWGGASAALAWIRLPLAHLAWIVLMVGFSLPTGGNQLSMNRYVLAAWPAFFLAGWILRRLPLAAAGLMVVDLAAMFLFARDHVLGAVFVG
jgi:hypothetical protein